MTCVVADECLVVRLGKLIANEPLGFKESPFAKVESKENIFGPEGVEFLRGAAVELFEHPGD